MLDRSICVGKNCNRIQSDELLEVTRSHFLKLLFILFQAAAVVETRGPRMRRGVHAFLVAKIDNGANEKDISMADIES